MSLKIFEYFESTFKLWLPFLHYTLSSPSSHVGTLVWSLWNSTKAQGTLLDLHGPLYGPQNGPSKANFRGPFLKKGPAGSLHGPKWAMFLNRSQDNGQTWIYSLVWGQSDIRFRRYNCFDSRWANWPPPTGWGLRKIILSPCDFLVENQPLLTFGDWIW